MTTNQAIAMAFPLLTAAAVIVTGLFIRKPRWASAGKKRAAAVIATVKDVAEINEDFLDALGEAERHIKSANREIERARASVS